MPKRPKQLPARAPLTAEQILLAAYAGSPEHKTVRWWGGLPGAFVLEGGNASRVGKQQTTICPLVTKDDKMRATAWVQDALRAGRLRFYEGDQVFPKKIWYLDQETGQYWFGYCINTVSGEYKGWPTDEDDCVSVFGQLG